MSSAQSWKNIDPKVREAAREAAARQGMSLGEYLNQALANQQPRPPAVTPTAPPARARTRYASLAAQAELEEDDWSITGAAPRGGDPTRLAQRLESIERRTQLAVSGLDRAVTTIDRSVMGLAARIEEAEAMSSEAAERIADALEQFRAAGDMLSGKFDDVADDVEQVKERLETQVAVAEEVARRAEAAASFLSNEMKTHDAAMAQTLEQARHVAQEAARQANEASADAIVELRRLQEGLSDRLTETETSTRRTIAAAIEEVRAEQESETRSTREALLEEVIRLEGEIAARLAAAEALKGDQSELISRIEKAEAGAREATAGLRQAAGAAIADLRNSQLMLSARVKQIEDGGADVDLTDVRQQQQDIAERLAALETKTEQSPVADALAAFERRIAGIEGGAAAKVEEVDGAVKTLDQALQRLNERLAETESTANSAIRTLEETVSSLSAKVEKADAAQETEALRAMLEQRLDAMAQSVQSTVEAARTELEGARNESMEEALTDVNRRLAAAERRQAQTIEAISLEIKRMSETVDKRLRSVEARNDDAAAQAVREELTRMSAQLEARFDEIERREAVAFDRMGLEVGRLSERLEERVGAVEHRSAQAIEQVGEQVARMAERFNQRQDMLARDLSERMLDSEERSGARVSEAISSIMQRLAEVEEQSAEAIAPVQKAVSSVASKLDQYESAHEPPPAAEAHEPMAPLSPPTADFDDDEFSAFGELTKARPSPMEAAQPLRAGPLPPARTEEMPVASDDDIYFTDDEPETHGMATEASAEDVAAQPSLPASPEFKSFGVGDDDDLLVEDYPLEQTAEAPAPAPEPAFDDSPFWTPENTNEDSAAPAIEFTPPFDEMPPPLAEAATPPGKNDYLAQARKAAQAQSLPKTRPEPGPAPQLSLRGSSRVVLWGAASGVALLLIGGAYYLNTHRHAAAPQHPTAPPPAPSQPAASPPVSAEPDPFAATQAAPADQAASQAVPAEQQAAPAQNAAVVAAPLAPRTTQTLEQAAQGGNLVAQYDLALQRLGGGQAAAGITLLRGAAEHGLAMAQYRLAKVYERGEGVAVDLNIARQWTERAAAAGNRRAMHDLGVYYARGDGAPLDEAQAFRWFRQAAELGVSDSQYNLGVLYQQGRGVSANPSEALFWFAVAARQGDSDAAAHATALEAQLTPAQARQARARAQAFQPRAASALANGDFGPRPWATPAPRRGA